MGGNRNLGHPVHACSLTDAFSTFVQFTLAVFAFSSLIYKYTTEKPQRPLQVWKLDTLKLALGGGMSHFLNLVFALTFEDKNTNPCVWYFLGCLMDSTAGVLLCYILLEVFERAGKTSGIHVRGSYGDPPCLQRWGVQVFFWIIIVIIAKMVVVVVMDVNETWWTRLGQYILSPVSFNPKVELVVAMLIAPFLCNVMAFWIYDSFLQGGDWVAWAAGYRSVATVDVMPEEGESMFDDTDGSHSVL